MGFGIKFLVFIIINFAALGIGIWLSGEGSSSAWYQGVNKAPWTPPGWVFGSAWTLIMICFSVFMALAWDKVDNKTILLILFAIQLVLNIIWNPVFFNYNYPLAGLIIISALTILVAYFIFGYYKEMRTLVLFASPYLIWLIIAVSLNAYIVVKN